MSISFDGELQIIPYFYLAYASIVNDATVCSIPLYTTYVNAVVSLQKSKTVFRI